MSSLIGRSGSPGRAAHLNAASAGTRSFETTALRGNLTAFS
jgi:hypothetical protein